jgi:4,5-DOPA dioxygenase extradiol
MADRLPTLFLSHGAPDVVLRETPARTFLAGLATLVPPPRAVVVVSAHWEEPLPTVESGRAPGTIHDFGGFPAEMYRLRYPAPGDPALAARIVELLATAGLEAAMRERGYDHGAWTPMLLAWPAATIPLVQVSLLRDADAAQHYRLGTALAPLREDGVLVIGSGSAVHNLRQLGGPTPPWASAFESWLVQRVEAGDVAALGDWRQRAPQARQAHPSPEHLTPLLVAFGAAGEGARGRVLHRSWDLGSLAMTSFAFST